MFKLYKIGFLVFILVGLNHQLSAQLNCPTVGNLDATNLGISPSSPIYECQKATITAEWLSLTDNDQPYDADFHEATLIVSIPNQLIGTSGTLSVTASDGNTYWTPGLITQTDNEVRVPLTGVIPSGVQLTIIISNMTVNVTAFFENFNYSQSISLAVADCRPTDDEQFLQGNAFDGGLPVVASVNFGCTSSMINLDATANPNLFSNSPIASYSWSGPNSFSSTQEDPSFLIPKEDQALYVGTYTVTVTDNNGCMNTGSVNIHDGNCAALPVMLLSFDANPDGINTNLNWTTAQEINNSHFEIEFSINGFDFVKVDQVISGAGTTNDIIDYEYVHKNAGQLGQQLYYRLNQVDFDGSNSYSPVVLVEFENMISKSLNLYPNPVHSGTDVYLQYNDINKVEIFTATGRLLKQLQLRGQNNNAVINTDGLANGLYIIRVNGVDQKKLFITH